METPNFTLVDNLDNLTTLGYHLHVANKLINEEFSRLRTNDPTVDLTTAFELCEKIEETICRFSEHIEFLTKSSVID